MAVRGQFVQRADIEESGVFVPEGTDLEIDRLSVSSEWTTESSNTDQTVKDIVQDGQSRRRRVRLWRMRHRTKDWRASDEGRSGNSSSSSSSSASSSVSSSDTSTGSSSTNGGAVARSKRQRKEIFERWQQGLVGERHPAQDEEGEEDEAAAPLLPPSPPRGLLAAAGSSRAARRLRWYSSSKRYRSFAVAQGFLTEDDIASIHAAAKHRSVREINDRKGYLAFKHKVWRFEIQLRALQPDLYDRLLRLLRRADMEKWRRIRPKSKKVYPEIEYIEYDVARMGEPCYIEPHVDNKSAVTLVAMLSDSGDYVGGVSCFRRAEGRDGHREVLLHRGDAVLFRGEKLVHWITPVTAGTRIVLQIELSRV